MKFVCEKCGYGSAKSMGKCPNCGEWGSFVENITEAVNKGGIAGVKFKGVSSPVKTVRTLTQIETSDYRHKPTGIGEFDRVLGGGIVPGAAILLAGEPGVGKSTILNALAGKLSENSCKVLIVSGEESEEQIALRIKRVCKGDLDNIYIVSESELTAVLGYVEQVSPDIIIIDSIQTIASKDVDGKIGGVSQTTEVSTVLVKYAKQIGVPVVLVGHVTKEGSIAGPRTIEHLVDVVLFFEGDKDSTLRLLRGVKNRYGASDEIGCFEHTEEGIIEVADPSGLLLSKHENPVSGVVTSISLEGRRPLPIEIQSLVANTHLPVPRRAVSGLDMNRSVMIQAVVERYGRIRLSSKDIYVSTVGGFKTREPSVDLAVGLSLASSSKGVLIDDNTVIIGEVTLSGEIRNVSGLGRRIEEAYRLGFTRAIVPKHRQAGKYPIDVIQVSNIVEAINKIESIFPVGEM